MLTIYLTDVHNTVILRLLLGPPSRQFPRSFPTRIMYAFLVSPFQATCCVHLSLRDFAVLRIQGCMIKSRSLSLCSCSSCQFTYHSSQVQMLVAVINIITRKTPDPLLNSVLFYWRLSAVMVDPLCFSRPICLCTEFDNQNPRVTAKCTASPPWFSLWYRYSLSVQHSRKVRNEIFFGKWFYVSI
jgi:hypothetical protein